MSFQDQTSLDLHMETHMATKMVWQCEICQKIFATEKRLKIHVKCHMKRQSKACELFTG